ncbi:winged helix-turn-helix transcriptional regulator [Streptomyces sp. A5-4]|uniref:winged helix-turn-helix transcriptional regulator n=1 Tax=Streptomyces sp. A5-4 TaxID=3384771 RepID=UPI003DA8FB4A
MARDPAARPGPRQIDFLADCRARLGFDLLANTWSSVTLWALRDGPLRHGQLKESLGGIRTKVLTETLRRLEFNGLLRREERAGPTRVDYELTDLGRSLLGPIEAVGVWSQQYGDEVLAAQDRAETRAAG